MKTNTKATRLRRRARPSRLPCRPASEAVQLIWDVVARIPAGRVATYGSVARAAGLARGARQAGYALRVAPPGLELPWHRVVSAGGRIAFAKDSAAWREQIRRLRGEGVSCRGQRVDAAALMGLEEL